MGSVPSQQLPRQPCSIDDKGCIHQSHTHSLAQTASVHNRNQKMTTIEFGQKRHKQPFEHGKLGVETKGEVGRTKLAQELQINEANSN